MTTIIFYLALGLLAAALLKIFHPRPEGLPMSKVRQSQNVAIFVQSDGRTYRKYYDQYGGVGRSKPSLLPWGYLFHYREVRALRSR